MTENVSQQRPERPAEQVAWKVKAWAKAVGLGVSSVQTLIKLGEIHTVKIGPSIVLVTTSPREWIEARIRDQQAGKPTAAISSRIATKPPRLAIVADRPMEITDPTAQPVRPRGRPKGATDRAQRRPRSVSA